MTQPCHKNTTLNQQCCDSKHKNGRRGKAESPHYQNLTPHKHHPTLQTHTPTALPHTPHKTKEKQGDIRGAGTTQRGDGNNAKGRIQSEDGAPPHIPHPALQYGRHANNKGNTNAQTGGTVSTPPPFNAMPPTTTTHALPSTTAPPATTVRGGDQRITHRTKTSDRQTHTAHHAPGKKQYAT